METNGALHSQTKQNKTKQHTCIHICVPFNLILCILLFFVLTLFNFILFSGVKPGIVSSISLLLFRIEFNYQEEESVCCFPRHAKPTSPLYFFSTLLFFLNQEKSVLISTACQADVDPFEGDLFIHYQQLAPNERKFAQGPTPVEGRAR